MQEFKKDDYHTISFNQPFIKQRDVKSILSNIQQSVKDNILIDMTGVRNCTNGFFRIFMQTAKKISLVNTDSEILTAIYMMHFDKYIKIYNEKISFLFGKNELKNGRLTVIK